MADDEAGDVEVAETKVVRSVERLTKILQHDCAMTFAIEVLEMAECILDVLGENYNYKDVATKLKLKLEKEQGGTWHAIAGPHFGVNVTNDAETLINMKIDEMYILVFRSGPPERPVDTSAEEKQE